MFPVRKNTLLGVRSSADSRNRMFVTPTSERRRHHSPGPVDPAALPIPIEMQMAPTFGLVSPPALALILALILETRQKDAHFLVDPRPSSLSDAW